MHSVHLRSNLVRGMTVSATRSGAGRHRIGTYTDIPTAIATTAGGGRVWREALWSALQLQQQRVKWINAGC